MLTNITSQIEDREEKQTWLNQRVSLEMILSFENCDTIIRNIRKLSNGGQDKSDSTSIRER